jgi:hypothetical protein
MRQEPLHVFALAVPTDQSIHRERAINEFRMGGGAVDTAAFGETSSPTPPFISDHPALRRYREPCHE